MAYHISISPKYNDFNKLYVFANTGQEKVETIDFLRDIVKFWNIPLNLIEGKYSTVNGIGVKHTVIDSFDNLDMDSKVFEAAIEHLNKNKWVGVPNQAVPYCSEYLKKRPIHSLAKEVFNGEPYITALGYRKEDMPKRITYQELKETPNKIAPLLTDFTHPVGIPFIDEFFDAMPFKLGIHSEFGNCELCHKRSEKKTY
jgi:hypothetical protein